MSAFLTNLDVRNINDSVNSGRGKWQLLADFSYQSDVANKTITVPVGFITDFASVPRIPVAYMLAGDTAHKAAVIHDWLYTSHELPREVADLVLQEAAIVGGSPAWRAKLIYVGVRVGGSGSYDADGIKQPINVLKVINEKVDIDPTDGAGA